MEDDPKERGRKEAIEYSRERDRKLYAGKKIIADDHPGSEVLDIPVRRRDKDM